MIEGIEFKQCKDCLNWFPMNLDNFNVVNVNKDKFNHRCISCQKKYSHDKYQKNRKHVKEKSKIWNHNHPERRIEYRREYYLNNLDIWYDRQKIYNDTHAKQIAEKEKEWAKNNPHKTAKYNKYRYHKKHNITNKQWINCKNYFMNDKGEWSCAYCGLPINEHYQNYSGVSKNCDFHKEHVDDEGSNELDNCVPSCQSCNSSKRQYKLETWYNPNNKRRGGKVFSEERLNKIINWITKDYKLYI